MHLTKSTKELIRDKRRRTLASGVFVLLMVAVAFGVIVLIGRAMHP